MAESRIMTRAIRLMHLETLLSEHINLSPTASQPYRIQPEPGPWRSLADEQKATPNFYCGLRGQLVPFLLLTQQIFLCLLCLPL